MSCGNNARRVLNICARCQLPIRRISSCPFAGQTKRSDNAGVTSTHLDRVESSPSEHVDRTPDGINTPTPDDKRYSDIPGPKAYPLIGTMYKYIPFVGSYNMRDQMGTDRKRFKKFGSLVREKIFPSFTVYHVYDLDIIRLVYDQERKYPERFPLPGLKAYRELRKTSMGLALKSGEDWRSQRRSANDLMKPDYVANFFGEQIEIAGDFNHLISKSTNEQEEIQDTLSLCYRYALESVGNVLFRKRLGTLEPTLQHSSEAMQLIDAVTLAMDSLYHTTYFWPLHKSQRTTVWKNLCRSIDYIMEVGKKHAEELKKDLETSSPDSNVSFMKTILSKPGLTTEDAMTLMTDVIFAGIESTALVMFYNMYNLARFPEKQEKLYQEIMTLAPPGEPLTPEVINKMKYMKAVMKETFRFTPLGVGNARILTKDLKVNGHKIPKKSLLLLNNTMACESPEYVKEPQKYMPERWLEDSGEKLHPYLVLPFGLGARSCLGRRLSMMEMKIALLKMVQTFKFEYHDEDVNFVTRFSNTPDRPVKFRIIKRT